MKICVAGAGVIGLTTAYALARRGHEVTVVDAAAGPGRGTSLGNGGQLSYAYVAPLADPSVWKHLPSYLFRKDSPLSWKPALDFAQWRWLLAFLRACNAATSAETTRHLLNLAAYSRQCLEDLNGELALEFNWREAGKLVMVSSDAALASAARQVELQARLGCKQQVLSAEECIALEPALEASRSRWRGGVYTPTEQVGDCAGFCEQLAQKLADRRDAVHLLYNTSITGAVVRGGKVHALSTSRGAIEADAFVLANGFGSAPLASRLGFRLPVYPLKGYSITFDVSDSVAGVPQVSITDQAKKIVYARLGTRLRVAGRVDIVGNDSQVDPGKTAALEAEARQLFPDLEKALPAQSGWAGMRPATPSGRPIIGRSPLANLYLNVGHGALGWTLACGSAELLASVIAHEPLPVDGSPFAYR